MRLVTYEETPHVTLQGEGILVGTPSVFVRLHGCSYSCSWCDSKDSWREGSTWKEKPVEDTLQEMRESRLRHAVITGGDPLLQAEELADLIVGLQQEWRDPRDGWNFRPGMHVTVETQAALYDESVARHADLLSLSPKLHHWRGENVNEYVRAVLMRPGRQVQIKIVCGGAAEDPELALERICSIFGWAEKLGSTDGKLFFILQPEGSGGRSGVKEVHTRLTEWVETSQAGFRYPTVRVIPQTHKTSLFVR